MAAKKSKAKPSKQPARGKKVRASGAKPSRAPKAATPRKPAPKAKKPAARPAVKAKAPVRKAAVATKKPAPARKPAPAKKVLPPRPVSRMGLPSKEMVELTINDHPAKSPYHKKELEIFRKSLLELRDRVVDGISFLAGENLQSSQREAAGDLSNYGMHMADQGTDNFDRDLALNLVSNEQDLIYEIDEALHRIEAKTYGVCEMTGQPIENARLKAIPYARYCREAQEQMERGRKRFRPFGPSMLQTTDSGS
jgi:RNA polymerase-binding protein DksA